MKRYTSQYAGAMPKTATRTQIRPPVPLTLTPLSGAGSGAPRPDPMTTGFGFVQWEFGLRIWVLVAVFGMAPAYWLVYRFMSYQRHLRRKKRGHCLACGYD